MKTLLIFVLFLVACDTTNACHRFKVTISDALPIQFWLNDCDTYNQKEVCGVHHKCWCAPWNCDDELIIQFSDESVSEYVLRVYDEDENFIEDIDFVVTTFLEDAFSDLPFTSWTNIPTGDGNAWTIDSTPSVSLVAIGSSEISDYLRRPIVIPTGLYDIQYDVNIGVVNPLIIKFRKNGVDVGSCSISPFNPSIGSKSVTISDETDEVIIYTSVSIFSSGTVTINNMFMLFISQKDPIYTANYTPINGSESICNERIRLEIVEVGVTPENVIAKSDCIDVRTDHDCTTLIEYRNNVNVFGLVYQDISPEQSFKIRVPAIFFHEKFTEEDNIIELTDSIVKTSSQLKAQRLFETDYIPYYMHRKIMLILKHQFVLIDNQYWTKEESYDVQDGERRWPVKKAKCFLTEKDYVQRAIL